MIIFIFQEQLVNYTFFLFLVMMLLFLVFLYFFMPETRGKTFEEIADEFSTGDILDVEEVVID